MKANTQGTTSGSSSSTTIPVHRGTAESAYHSAELQTTSAAANATIQAQDAGAVRTGSWRELASPQGVPIPRQPVVKLALRSSLPVRLRVRQTSAPQPKTRASASDGRHIVRFEGGEHTYLGDSAQLTLVDHSTVTAGSYQLRLENGLQLTYGQILALGGDFYGLPDEPISQDPAPPNRFVKAFNTLNQKHESFAEATKILDVMHEEIAAVSAALAAAAGTPQEATAASTEYENLGDSLSEKWNRITGGGSPVSPWIPMGRYLKLAAKNFDHFGANAVQAYSIGHGVAMEKAVAAHNATDPQSQLQLLQAAYAMNAFADHFLTDLFSAGHIRTPRYQLYKQVTPSEAGSYCARYMHDEDSWNGLEVQNTQSPPASWKSYGDRRLFDAVDATNLRYVEAAVQASVNDVVTAFQTGSVVSAPSALPLIPDLSQFQGTPTGPNPSPMFVQLPSSSTVQRRKDLANVLDYHWTKSWWGWSTLALLGKLKPDTEPEPPIGFKGLIRPETAPVLSFWNQNLPAPNGSVWNLPNFQVRYAVSFFDEFGESGLGPWSSWLSGSGQYWGPQLKNLPLDRLGKASGRRIYRQFRGYLQQLARQIDDNTTTETWDELNAMPAPEPPDRPPTAVNLQYWNQNLPAPDGSVWNLPNFQVRYAVSFVDAVGESLPGPWSQWFSGGVYWGPQLVNVPIDHSGRATSRRLYRQFLGYEMQMVQEIPDNTTTSVFDENAAMPEPEPPGSDIRSKSVGAASARPDQMQVRLVDSEGASLGSGFSLELLHDGIAVTHAQTGSGGLATFKTPKLKEGVLSLRVTGTPPEASGPEQASH